MMPRQPENRSAGRRRLRVLEAGLWVLAALLVAPQALVMAARGGLSYGESPVVGPDETWSDRRRAAFERFSRGLVPQPAGYLALPGQNIRVPIFDGTGELALTLGAGHLPDTAPLGGDGNAAIAGHRDGFFRALRLVTVGDRLSIETAGQARPYRVTEQWVVAPEDLWVLEPTAEPSVTLITCYPFYYAGNAPERFILRAVLVDDDPEEEAAVMGASTTTYRE
jgi:LPXTG-site transpeptidase (sortase) family protein